MAKFGLSDYAFVPLFCPTCQTRLHPPSDVPSPASTVHGVVLRILSLGPPSRQRKTRPRERGRALSSCDLLEDQPRVRERIMKLS